MTITIPGRETRCIEVPELRAVRAEGGKGAKLVGYAAVYNQRSRLLMGSFVEIIKPGAFARALRGDDDVRALWNHNSDQVLGRLKSGTLRLFDDAKGLRYEIDLPDTQFARDLTLMVERGDVSQSSFAFRTIRDSWAVEKTDAGTLVDIRYLEDLETFDVSPVTYPAYPQTEVAMRSLEQHRAAAGVPVSVRRRRLDLLERA